MTKITEEQRAELLASNASRDVVEAVLARLDAAERMLVTAMEPRSYARGYDSYDEDCPFCDGHDHRLADGGRGYEHAAGCEWVAWGTGLYEWHPMHGPQMRAAPFTASTREAFSAAMRAFDDQLTMSPLVRATGFDDVATIGGVPIVVDNNVSTPTVVNYAGSLFDRAPDDGDP